MPSGCAARAPHAGLGRESGVLAEREGGVGSGQVKGGGKERNRLEKIDFSEEGIIELGLNVQRQIRNVKVHEGKIRQDN